MNRKCIRVLALFVVALAAPASAQTPVEFSASPLSFAILTSGNSFAAENVLGTAHPEVLREQGGMLVIEDLHATNGVPALQLGLFGIPESVAVGDIDQDGDRDIVVRTEAFRQVMVIKQQPGQGQFTFLPLAAAWRDPVHLVDIDGDGSLDILCGGERWMNDGAGNFSAPIAFYVGAASSVDVLAGDVDGDGDMDLISTFLGNSPTGPGFVSRIIRRNSDGTETLLTGTLISAGATFGRAHIGDVNADGRADLLYLSSIGSQYDSTGFNVHYRFGVMTGTAGTSFTAQPSHDDYFLPGQVLDFAVGDIDQDGRTDIAMPVVRAHPGSGFWSNFAVLFMTGTASGDLLPAIGPGLVTGNQVLSYMPKLLLADDDLDGDQDLYLLGPAPQVSRRALNVPPSPVSPKLFEAIGTNLCATINAQGNVQVGPVNGIAGARLTGRYATATFQSGASTSTFQQLVTDNFEFPVPPFASSFPTSLTISIAEGPAFSGTFYPSSQFVMNQTNGSGQTAALGQAFPNPIGGRLTNMLGQPLAGVRIDTMSSPDIFPSQAGPFYTDANGDISIALQAGGTPTSMNFLVTCDLTIVATFALTVGNYGLTMTGGAAGQTTCPFAPFPIPLTGFLTDGAGQPAGGMTVNFINATPTTGIVFSPASCVTAADGSFLTTVIAQGNVGPATALLVVNGTSASTTVPFNVGPTTLALVAGDGQIGYAGDTLPIPLTVQLGTCGSFANTPITFTSPNSGTSFSSAIVFANAAGIASTVATFSPNAAISQPITASAAGSSVTFQLICRRFRSIPSGNTIVLNYTHEHGGVPLTLAAELASATPAITTPWGTIQTSILSPGPSFAVLDGLGLFGPADPTMFTAPNGSWTRFVTAPSPLGLTFRLQMYGYDVQAAYPRDYIVSNSTTLNL